MSEKTSGFVSSTGESSEAGAPCCSCSCSLGRSCRRVRRSMMPNARHRPCRGRHWLRYRGRAEYRPARQLIYSTAQRDDVTEVVATDDPALGQAFAGQTVSVLSSTADAVEPQRAQESFTNTQVELTNANRKLREAEARIREPDRGGGVRSAEQRGGRTRPALGELRGRGSPRSGRPMWRATPGCRLSTISPTARMLPATGRGNRPATRAEQPEPLRPRSSRRRASPSESSSRGPQPPGDAASADDHPAGAGPADAHTTPNRIASANRREIAQWIDRVCREQCRFNRRRREHTRDPVAVPPAEL